MPREIFMLNLSTPPGCGGVASVLVSGGIQRMSVGGCAVSFWSWGWRG